MGNGVPQGPSGGTHGHRRHDKPGSAPDHYPTPSWVFFVLYVLFFIRLPVTILELNNTLSGIAVFSISLPRFAAFSAYAAGLSAEGGQEVGHVRGRRQQRAAANRVAVRQVGNFINNEASLKTAAS